jgi:hypothetical protein
MDLEKTRWAGGQRRTEARGGVQYNAWRRVREVLERHRDLHVEPEIKRAADKFTFAELGENEEDLAELEAWYANVRAWVRSSPLPTKQVHEGEGGG